MYHVCMFRVSLVCRLHVHVYFCAYVCTCGCKCTRVCGCAVSRSMSIASLSTICCVSPSTWEKTRVAWPRVFSRAARILGAAFLVSAKKRNFFTLRRNKAQTRVARIQPGFRNLGIRSRYAISATRDARARAYTPFLPYSLCVVLCATKV